MIAIDVARASANTAIMIFRVNVHADYFVKNLVYTQVLYDMRFDEQAVRIKQLNNLYRPREVVVDGTGLGVGLVDYLTGPSVDPETGEILQPLGVINNQDYTRHQPPELPCILYVLKANPQLNTEAHSNFYTQLAGGHCRFLASQQQVRSRLLTTTKGQKMSPLERAKFLLPYEMTTKLFDEIANLKIKNNINTLQVERISNRVLKDRFSAFEYGLYRIKFYEDQYYRLRHKRERNLTAFLMFTKK